VGYFAFSIAENNATYMYALGELFQFKWMEMRLRCAGHVINLVTLPAPPQSSPPVKIDPQLWVLLPWVMGPPEAMRLRLPMKVKACNSCCLLADGH